MAEHHMMGGMGGGCCISFNDLGAESALADFGTESDFLTWKQSQELFFFSLSWPKVDHHMGGGGNATIC